MLRCESASSFCTRAVKAEDQYSSRGRKQVSLWLEESTCASIVSLLNCSFVACTLAVTMFLSVFPDKAEAARALDMVGWTAATEGVV